MNQPAPQLRLVVNADTGELVEQDERDVLIEQLQGELKGKSLQIGKLRKEVRTLRAIEPEAAVITEVLAYWKERCKPTAEISIAGKRWEKVRARLRDSRQDRNPWTPEELKLAVDGALLDPWLNGTDRNSKGYLDAETIFRDAEMVEKLRDLAMGFNARAGVPLGDLLDFTEDLHDVDWRFLLRTCVCQHRRFAHSKADPNQEGREACLTPGCACIDFDMDSCNEFNLRVDPWLARFFGKGEAA